MAASHSQCEIHVYPCDLRGKDSCARTAFEVDQLADEGRESVTIDLEEACRRRIVGWCLTLCLKQLSVKLFVVARGAQNGQEGGRHTLRSVLTRVPTERTMLLPSCLADTEGESSRGMRV